MADSKDTSSEQVVDAPVEAQAPAVAPAVEDKVAGEGENLYFFPDIQKSVVAKSLDEATKQVQGELDALKEEGNK